MLRRFASAFTLAAASAASLIGTLSDASACSLPAAGWYLINVAGAAPANGVLVMHYTCYVNCSATTPDPSTFTLTNAAGALVHGEVMLTGVDQNEPPFVVFRPEPGAFVKDDLYTAAMDGASPFEGVVIAQDTTWTSDIGVTDEMHEIDYSVGESVCCDGPVDTCGGLPCFPTEIDRKTALTVTWANESAPDTWSQYAYRLLVDGAVDLPVAWSWSNGTAGLELGEDQDSVCYVLELQKLIDGTVQQFEPRCVERPDTFTPGVQPTPAQTIRDVLGRCENPPSGYDDEWCAAREELCALTMEPYYCETFATRCEATGGQGGSAGAPPVVGGSAGSAGAVGGNGGAPRGGSAGTGISGGGSGGTEPDAAGAGPDSGDAGEASDGGGERIYTKGCGCAVPGNAGSHAPSLSLMALALTAFGLRRRAQRNVRA